MTQEEFSSLRPGDKIELLERDFVTRTGIIILVEKVSGDHSAIYYRRPSGTKARLSNRDRVAYCELELSQ